VAVCASCAEPNPEAARFCHACGAALADAGEAAQAIRKTVTVLFCDVVDSTARGERVDPEAVRRVMSRYFDEMRAALEAHGGTVEKFIGDAVMAVFGVPTVHEDDALRAVRAGAEMRERLARLNGELEEAWGVRLQIRIGINTGGVVAGDPSTGHTIVTGDVVNTAKRLEEAAGPGGVLIGHATYRLVQSAVRAGTRERLRVRSSAAPPSSACSSRRSRGSRRRARAGSSRCSARRDSASPASRASLRRGRSRA
jgi:class 3 adenylate cyclase